MTLSIRYTDKQITVGKAG